MIKISCISGSLRQDSHCQKAIQQAMKLLEAHGAKAHLLDLKVMKLPFCNGGDKYPEYPDVEKLRKEVRESQGLILCSPEYHGGISGVLKNTLDLLSFEHIRGKHIGIVSILGGASSFNAVNNIIQACHHLHAWVLPRPLIIPHADKAFTPEGDFSDAQHNKRLNTLTHELITAIERASSH